MTNKTWGKWSLDETTQSLNLPLPWHTYKIALSRCRTVQDRQRQINEMVIIRYVTRQDLRELRQALDDLVAAGVLPNELTLREVAPE